jgi:hypothetical protein
LDLWEKTCGGKKKWIRGPFGGKEEGETGKHADAGILKICPRYMSIVSVKIQVVAKNYAVMTRSFFFFFES